jgi:hypothetical protein
MIDDVSSERYYLNKILSSSSFFYRTIYLFNNYLNSILSNGKYEIQRAHKYKNTTSRLSLSSIYSRTLIIENSKDKCLNNRTTGFPVPSVIYFKPNGTSKHLNAKKSR